MAALPTARTVLSRPFTTTGVDFTGPFEIKNYTGRACLITKGYVCVFICFATKAIHLEAVSSLSTPAFLGALSRFISRRGCPKNMYSDNGFNFVGASRVLQTEFRSFFRDVGSEVNVSYANQGIKWHFNPASAPHMGGLWESGVKSFKHHFRRIAGNFKYTFEEFSTLLARIESCLNSRPLCPLSDSLECLDCLTPGHFLTGGPLLAPREVEVLESPISIINRWQRVKALNQRLCSRWKDEYLKDLQKRNKWKFAMKDLQVGDMVVIKEDNMPTNEWRLGRVEKLHMGKDGHVRVVGVKTARGSIEHGQGHEGRRTTKQMVCRVCLKDHPLRFCKKFLQVEYEERMRLVSIYRYCAGCLSHDHTWRTCESTGTCKHCGDMHHTLLHKVKRRSTSVQNKTKRLRHGPRSSSGDEGEGPRSSSRDEGEGPGSSSRNMKKGPSSSAKSARGTSSSVNSARGPRSPNNHDDERPSTSQALVLSTSKNRHIRPRGKYQRSCQAERNTNGKVMSLPVLQIRETILLKPTAIIRVEAAGRFINERVLIDPSAACSVISDELVHRISARRVRVGKKERCYLKIGGQYGSSTTVETYAEVRRGYKVITPAKSIEASILDEFPGLQLADPQFNVAAPVMMMIGGDVYSQIIRNGIYGGTPGKPLSKFSIFGYLISGPCSF